MSKPLIIVTGLIYAYVAAEQFLRFGNVGAAIMFSGYAVANIGVYQTAS